MRYQSIRFRAKEKQARNERGKQRKAFGPWEWSKVTINLDIPKDEKRQVLPSWTYSEWGHTAWPMGIILGIHRVSRASSWSLEAIPYLSRNLTIPVDRSPSQLHADRKCVLGPHVCGKLRHPTYDTTCRFYICIYILILVRRRGVAQNMWIGALSFAVEVRTNQFRKFTNNKRSNRRFFMIVLDIDIYYVHRLHSLLFTVIEICNMEKRAIISTIKEP